VYLLLWEQLLQLLHQRALGYASRPHTGAKRDAALLPVGTSNGDAAVFHFHNFAVQHQLSACTADVTSCCHVTWFATCYMLPVRASNGDAVVFHFDDFAVQHQLSACRAEVTSCCCEM
jgi:hypothetical protein